MLQKCGQRNIRGLDRDNCQTRPRDILLVLEAFVYRDQAVIATFLGRSQKKAILEIAPAECGCMRNFVSFDVLSKTLMDAVIE